MQVTVTKSDDACWYKNALGKVFDVKLDMNPTFKFEYYLLLNTKRNQKYFNNDELSLLFLRDGFKGISYKDCV